MLQRSFARKEDRCLIVVVDASVLVEVPSQTERGRHLEVLLSTTHETLHTPRLIDIKI